MGGGLGGGLGDRGGDRLSAGGVGHGGQIRGATGGGNTIQGGG